MTTKNSIGVLKETNRDNVYDPDFDGFWLSYKVTELLTKYFKGHFIQIKINY